MSAPTAILYPLSPSSRWALEAARLSKKVSRRLLWRRWGFPFRHLAVQFAARRGIQIVEER